MVFGTRAVSLLSGLAALLGVWTVTPPEARSAPVAQPGTAAEASGHPLVGTGQGVDHVLLWTRDADRSSSILREKLGFNVMPGGSFPGSLANRLANFKDDTYLELLHFTIPIAEASDETLGNAAFLRERDGANGFGIHVSSLEAAVAFASAAGFDVAAPAPGSWDPDGPEGPQPSQDSLFRTAGFRTPPVAGLDPFFVWYRPSPARTPERQARFEARTTHRNKAQRLTAVWIVTEDAAASAQAFQRMGFAASPWVDLPHLGGRGLALTAGRGAILLVAPYDSGIAADSFRRRGPHVIGVSIEVSDLEAAGSIISGSYGEPSRYSGPFGEAVLAPSLDDLGIFVEFHR